MNGTAGDSRAGEFRYANTAFGVDHPDAADGGSATIGTNDGDGSTAAQHSFDTASVSPWGRVDLHAMMSRHTGGDRMREGLG